MSHIRATYAVSPGYRLSNDFLTEASGSLSREGPIETPFLFELTLEDGVGVDDVTYERFALGEPRLVVKTGLMTDPTSGEPASALSHKVHPMIDGEIGPESFLNAFDRPLTGNFQLPTDVDLNDTSRLGVRFCLNGDQKNCTEWTFATPKAALADASSKFNPVCAIAKRD